VGSGEGHPKDVTTTADTTRQDKWKNGENQDLFLKRQVEVITKPVIPQSGKRDTCC
jgi:hypothetical protein